MNDHPAPHPLTVETFTPPGTMTPIGPYSHIAKVGPLIMIGAVAGVDPATGKLAGPDAYTQAGQIIGAFKIMLESVGSDLDHVMHVNVYLKEMADFDAVNRVYAEKFGAHRPARTTVGVRELPKPGAVVTMSVTAVTRTVQEPRP
jgi:2-iminobutanoate/2-iminopropanoate deaminase